MRWSALARVVLALMVALLILCLALWSDLSHSAERVVIPERSAMYQFRLTRAVAERYGDTAKVAQFAAQFHAESGWHPNAQSKYAAGLAQFTPPTAAWLPTVCPDIGPPDAWNPEWSIRAAVCYRRYLERQNTGATRCDRDAFALADYNGGGKWRKREQALAFNARDDPAKWFGSVADHRSRSLAAWTENRSYVHRILHVLEPAYIAAGWPGKGSCI